jgi:hypothetical protein
MVFSTAMRIINKSAEAEDVSQQVFYKHIGNSAN